MAGSVGIGVERVAVGISNGITENRKLGVDNRHDVTYIIGMAHTNTPTRTITRSVTTGDDKSTAAMVAGVDLFGWVGFERGIADGTITVDNVERTGIHAVFNTPTWRVTFTAPADTIKGMRNT